jgi:3alpha(or 20beta)-hydroxysteroid dehydrogenase
MSQLEGKVIIITGAAQGMGRATAELATARGATVILTDINAEAGERTAREIGGTAEFLTLDVTSADAWSKVVETVSGKHGKIDGLVNNAGAMTSGFIDAMEEDKFRRMLDIDLIGPWLGLKAVLPHMKANRSGSVVNISSVLGLNARAERGGYCASKFALLGITRTTAKEVGPFGVRVNSVLPGTIETPMLLAASGGSGEFDNQRFYDIAMNRYGKPEEVAAATLFLLSDDASYISGIELVVDGGWNCGTYSLNKPDMPAAV